MPVITDHLPSPAERRAERNALEAAQSLATSVRTMRRAWPQLADRVAGGPGAVAPDAARGSVAPWCWEHERSVTACHESDLLCRGEAIDTHDPTGEAAISHDPARRAHDRILQVAARANRAAGELASLLATLSDRLPVPTATELALTAKVNTPGCALCAKVTAPGYPDLEGSPGWWNEVHRRTDVGGALAEPIDLCHAHIRRIKSTGAVPSKADLAILRDTGKWPAMRIDPKTKISA